VTKDPAHQAMRGTAGSDLEWRETIAGRRPGDRVVRIATHRQFDRVAPGYLIPRDGVQKRSIGGLLRRLIIGAPLRTTQEIHERLTKVKALAVFSSDALSSVAYATEEIMKVAILAGAGALALTLPISGVIIALLAIVVISYRQTIRAYPSGGGSYIVASDNLGRLPGLVAAASLMTDYVLTVSVSVAAGIAALTSLVPALLPFVVELSIAAVILICVGNLRGIRDSGTIFAVPTYVFVATMLVLISVGIGLVLTGRTPEYQPPPSAIPSGSQGIGIVLLLSAFAQGCTAMTGTEAISNGVPAFRPPEWKNARSTLVAMGLLLAIMFAGTSFLAATLHIHPATEETVLSQIGRTVFGPGPIWILLQVATALILILAANTAFADFPRLASILGRDRFLPRMFSFRGDRLAFTTGIVLLALVAIALLVVFHGSLDGLIPLYAVGVFSSFTLSQAGMVVHWRRERGPRWRQAAIINGVGAVATGAVTLVIAGTKFIHGAWLIVVLIPLIIALFVAIRSHYDRLAVASEPETPLLADQVKVRMVVPIASLDVRARQALAYAKAISRPDASVIAVHVADSPDAATAFRDAWQRWGESAELVIVESPYRSLVRPFLAYTRALQDLHPGETITVVLPEFVPSRWWENLLHNQSALRLKAALLYEPGIVVANVPYHLGR
jgi:amino acid transporter